MKRILILLAALGLAACSPALNWRDVSLPGTSIVASFPCKPDHAERAIELIGSRVAMSMDGCEADGAMLAISHLTLDQPTQAGAALEHWRQAVLARMHASDAASTTHTAPFVPKGALNLPASVRTQAQGQRADGSAVVAEGMWMARMVGNKAELLHAVVYTAKPRPEVADVFFSGVVLR